MALLSDTEPGHGKTPTAAIIILGLVILWALVDVTRSYPVSFHPRFWDEAIYMIDVRAPGALLAPEAGAMRYAPAKLGYGLPLAGAVKLFGEPGAMYLSTFCWLLAIAGVSVTVLRRFGILPGLFAAAFLAYSPLFGKYIAEAGPTTMAAMCFVLLWMVYPGRQFWVVGLVIGALAAVDFKWMPPVAVSIAVAELVIERQRSWKDRLLFVGGSTLTSLTLLTVIKLIHPPFGDYLWSYVSRHSGIVGFAPSGIFGYYLLLFGAMPAVVVAGAAYSIGAVRRGLDRFSPESAKALLYACVFSCVPILFYSTFGSLKALRFYAVMFPLFAVPVAGCQSDCEVDTRTLLGTDPNSTTVRCLDGRLADGGIDPDWVRWSREASAFAKLLPSGDGPTGIGIRSRGSDIILHLAGGSLRLGDAPAGGAIYHVGDRQRRGVAGY